MLSAKEIRQRFLEFFAKHGHDVVASGPLIPANDPTLLFTNAGMVPFKKFFLGEEQRSNPRVASSQKCLRVSGKHNDLENVGRTARHHTFFEMLGNFSFGDYFKREAITLAWDFLTNDLKLPKKDLWVTVFREDDEAAELWQEIAKLPAERIVRMGEKDNFWTMGDTGPCGPCSEIYIDQGEHLSCGPNCGIGKCDCDRYLEIWNLVFTQFDQLANGTRTKLARPNIDTGMGLERIAAVCQGKQSNFDSDLFQDIIQHAASLAGVKYSFSTPDTNDVDTALRVIADHARSAAFLIADGVLPSNEGRGYVLRRLIRRALRFATLIGVHEPFLYRVCTRVCEVMGDAWAELTEHSNFIARAVHEEEQRFSVTLDNGLEMLETEMNKLQSQNNKIISGDFCFLLSDTYGFPLDIVKDIAEQRHFTVDVDAFEALMAEQRNRARASQKKSGLFGDAKNKDDKSNVLAELDCKVEFTGYSTLSGKAKIISLLDEKGQAVSELTGKGHIICESTPFYGESGGQIGDIGTISNASAKAKVLSTSKPSPDLIVHEIELSQGSLTCGEEISLEVDMDARLATARHHTCTHLLHATLREVLGKHVRQAGSHVTPQRLRFDFSHIAALTAEEIASIEQRVNAIILANLEVKTREMPIKEAQELGAMALFGEKYGDIVRVVSVGDLDAPVSLEFCGGTHLSWSGQAGYFRIVSESAVAAGMRRIEAVAGWSAIELAKEQQKIIHDLGNLLKTGQDKLSERVQSLQNEIKTLRKQSEKAATSTVSTQDLGQKIEKIGDLDFLGVSLADMSVKNLREIMDDLRSRYAQAIIFLAGLEKERISLILYVPKNLHSRFTAPSLIKELATLCGGSGGGRPDLAQAGGNNPAAFNQALDKLKSCLVN